MKLQISILVIGIALGAGSVSAELHRSTSVVSASQSTGTTIAASQSSLTQPITTRSTLKQSVTTPSKISVTGIRPSISGGLSGGDD